MSFLKKFFSQQSEPTDTTKNFWSWFEKNERSFFNSVKERKNIEKNFFNKLSERLSLIADDIYFLTGMFDTNTVELVLTPDGIIKNIVFVEELVQSAPSISGWKFTALKQAIDLDKLHIEMQGFHFNSENLFFYSNDLAGFPDEIDITIVHTDFNEKDKSTITNGAFIFLDNYLGELDFITTVDHVTVTGKENNQKELIPISKLKEFLLWREKEFIEKYEGVRYNTENDEYLGLEAELNNGRPLIAVINSVLLDWDSKASHPWFLKIEFKYDGEKTNGMPDNKTYELMDKIEDEILEELKDYDGYLNLGRETADNSREIFFACKDFRKPSKVLNSITKKYKPSIDLSYDIYKDKYWRTMNRFKNQ